MTSGMLELFMVIQIGMDDLHYFILISAKHVLLSCSSHIIVHDSNEMFVQNFGSSVFISQLLLSMEVSLFF